MATRGALWTFADQAVSSLSTAALSIVIARSVTESEFGAYGVGLLIYNFLVGLARAVVSDPLVIRYAAAAQEAHRDAARRATGAALASGCGCGLIVAGVSLLPVFPPDLTVAMRLTALGLPFFLLQDAWRYVFLSREAPAKAFVNDMTWAVVQLGGLAVALREEEHRVGLLMACWVAGAAVGSLVGLVQMRTVPKVSAAAGWLAQHRDLTSRLGPEFALNQGSYNGSLLLIGKVDRLEAVGALSAARTLLGPMQLLSSAAASFVLPTMARRLATESPRRLAVVVGVALGASTVGVTIFLLAMPTSWGVWLLGDNWPGARSVLPAMGWTVAMVGFAMGAILGLKARERAGQLLTVTLLQAPLFVVLGAVGASKYGAVGGAVGLALAQSVGCALTWVKFLQHERAMERRPRRTAAAPTPDATEPAGTPEVQESRRDR